MHHKKRLITDAAGLKWTKASLSVNPDSPPQSQTCTITFLFKITSKTSRLLNLRNHLITTVCLKHSRSTKVFMTTQRDGTSHHQEVYKLLVRGKRLSSPEICLHDIIIDKIFDQCSSWLHVDFKTYPNSIFQVWTLKWIMELNECSCIFNKPYVTWKQTEPLSSFRHTCEQVRVHTETLIFRMSLGSTYPGSCRRCHSSGRFHSATS